MVAPGAASALGLEAAAPRRSPCRDHARMVRLLPRFLAGIKGPISLRLNAAIERAFVKQGTGITTRLLVLDKVEGGNEPVAIRTGDFASWRSCRCLAGSRQQELSRAIEPAGSCAVPLSGRGAEQAAPAPARITPAASRHPRWLTSRSKPLRRLPLRSATICPIDRAGS
jgi:hypothetical protein